MRQVKISFGNPVDVPNLLGVVGNPAVPNLLGAVVFGKPQIPSLLGVVVLGNPRYPVCSGCCTGNTTYPACLGLMPFETLQYPIDI